MELIADLPMTGPLAILRKDCVDAHAVGHFVEAGPAPVISVGQIVEREAIEHHYMAANNPNGFYFFASVSNSSNSF